MSRLALALLLSLCASSARAQVDGGIPGGAQVPLEALPRLELAVPDGGVFVPREGPVTVPAPAEPVQPEVEEAPGVEPDVPTLEPEPEPAPRITEIRIVGNERVPRERILEVLTQTVGEPFDPREAAEELRRLFALEQFADVELELEEAGGGVAYVIRVDELPLLNEVQIGKVTQLREEELRAALALETGEPVSAFELNQAEQRAERAFAAAGFARTDVELEPQPVPERNAVNVTVEVEERPRVRVASIDFEGVPQGREAALRREVPFSPAGLLSNVLGTSVFAEDRLEAAVEQLRTFYLNRGFANVQIQPELTFSEEGDRVAITFDISEGRQFRIGEVRVEGEVPLPEARVQEIVSLPEGTPLSRDEILVEANELQTALQNEGYACALVTPEVDLDQQTGLAEVVLEVRLGEQVRVGEIRVAGNEETKEEVILRSVPIDPGDPFTATAIQQTLVDLRALGFLEDVRVTLPEGCEEGEADLLVTVAEGKTTGYQLSVGFASVEQIVGTGRFVERNLFGTGRALSAYAQLSTLRSAVAVSYLEPFIFGSDVDVAVDGSWSRLEFESFTRQSAGASANASWAFGRARIALRPLVGTLGYTFQNVGVLNPPALPPDSPEAALFREGRVSSLSLGLSWNRNEEQLFVLTGPLLLGSVELSPDWLGATIRFVRYAGTVRWNVGSLETVLFRARATAGWVDAIGDEPVPVTERFFLGGIGSLRGYRFRSISPIVRLLIEPEGELEEIRVGGIGQVIVGAELEYPLIAPLRVNAVLFWDAGNAFGEDTAGVFDDRRDLPLGLFHAAGAGLRWYSPFGPIRLELALPLTRRPEDPTPLVEIGIGAIP